MFWDLSAVDWDVLLTRGLVWLLYVAAFIHMVRVDLVVKGMGGSWSRRASLHIMMLIAAYWIGFYTFLLVTQWDGLSSPSWAAMFSRIGHYITAAGGFVIASFIKMVSLQYAIVPVKDENE